MPRDVPRPPALSASAPLPAVLLMFAALVAAPQTLRAGDAESAYRLALGRYHLGLHREAANRTKTHRF